MPTGQFNRSPFQEINKHFQADFPNIIRPVVKRSFQPTRVDMLPLALRQAMTAMLSGRPGPVNVDVPFNVFQEEDDVEVPPPAPRLGSQRSGASPEQVTAALDLILKAERPVLFIGHGVTLSEAGNELTAFAQRLRIPVISSPNGMGCLDMTDALSLGFIGRNGAYPANEAGRRADVVIAIGARFDDRSASSWLPGYSWNFPHAKLIHVDVDADELGRNYPPDLPILADARTVLRQLLAEWSAAPPNPTARSAPGTPTSRSGRPSGRITGFRRVPPFVGHSGASGTVMFRSPELGLTVVGTVNQVKHRSMPYQLMVRTALAAGGRAVGPGATTSVRRRPGAVTSARRARPPRRWSPRCRMVACSSSWSARWRRARATATSSPIRGFGGSWARRWLTPVARIPSSGSATSTARAVVSSPSNSEMRTVHWWAVGGAAPGSAEASSAAPGERARRRSCTRRTEPGPG